MSNMLRLLGYAVDSPSIPDMVVRRQTWRPYEKAFHLMHLARLCGVASAKYIAQDVVGPGVKLHSPVRLRLLTTFAPVAAAAGASAPASLLKLILLNQRLIVINPSARRFSLRSRRAKMTVGFR